jgi:flagellar basal body-associated protein FliL
MSEDEAKKAAAAAAAPAPAKSGKGGPLALIIPAILAGGAAFGGARISGGPPPVAHPVEVAAEMPGPTISLEPFLVTIPDGARSHVVKLTVAVELKHLAKEEEFKAFIPRIRDATLTYLRSLSFEEASSSDHLEQMRTDIRERLKTIGATAVENVLITDFVTQ